MKLTLYRATILVLTNALTGLIAFSFGGAYATRLMEKKKDKERDSLSALFKQDREKNSWMPSMMKEDIESGYFEDKNGS